VRFANGTERVGTAEEIPGAEALAADLREGIDEAMGRAPRKAQRRGARRFFSFRGAALRPAETDALSTPAKHTPAPPDSSAPASGGDERAPQSMSLAG
jgi:hypothetical protein